MWIFRNLGRKKFQKFKIFKNRPKSCGNDSPGLKALRSNKRREVRKKIIDIENSKVKREKVSISPKKIRLKEISAKMQSRMIRYADDSAKKSNDKMNNKNDHDHKINHKKSQLIKDAIVKDYKIEGVEVPREKAIDDKDADKDENIAKDAFKIMLDSSRGGKITPNLPKKSMKRRSKFESPVEKKLDIRRWLEKK